MLNIRPQLENNKPLGHIYNMILLGLKFKKKRTKKNDTLPKTIIKQIQVKLTKISKRDV